MSGWFGRSLFLDKAASIACNRVVVVLDATPGWAGLARVRRVYGRLAGKFSEALTAGLARVAKSTYLVYRNLVGKFSEVARAGRSDFRRQSK